MADEQEVKKTEYVRVSTDELATIKAEMKELSAFKKKYDTENEPAQKRMKGIKTKFHTAYLAFHKLGDDETNTRPVVSVGKAYKNSKATNEYDDQLLPIWYLDDNWEMKKDVVPLWGFLRDAPRLPVKIVKMVKELRQEVDPKKGGGGEAEKQGAVDSTKLPQYAQGGFSQAYSDINTGQVIELAVGYMDTMTTIEFMDERFAGKTYTLPKNDDSALNV